MKASAMFLACLAIAAMSGAALAQQKPLEIDRIVKEQPALRSQLQTGSGEIGKLPQAQRDELLARQAEMLATLEGKRSAAELTPEEQLAVRSTLDAIADGQQGGADHQVCRREKRIGTNMSTRVCRTVAQLRIEREQSRDRLETRRICGTCSAAD